MRGQIVGCFKKSEAGTKGYQVAEEKKLLAFTLMNHNHDQKRNQEHSKSRARVLF